MLVPAYGVNGAGIAFFGSYIFHGSVIYPTVAHLSGFRWSAANKRTGVFFIGLIAVVFVAFYVTPPLVATIIGASACLASGVYSVRVLLTLVSLELSPSIRQLVGLFRIGLCRR
jgi:PST family polysaccharide transporter